MMVPVNIFVITPPASPRDAKTQPRAAQRDEHVNPGLPNADSIRRDYGPQLDS